MAVYPSNMAPFGLKLWENAFHMIPDISFFVGKICATSSTPQKVSKLPVLEEL